jgi:hypothetical protein
LEFHKPGALELLTLLVPFGIYLLAAWPLSHWVVDDAGITFSYARNFADGHGLVSQPGMEPVEGYSNFLWLLLMAPFFVVGLFDPYVVPKLVGFALVGMSYYLLHRSISYLTGGRLLASLGALLCLSVNTSFVVWTCCGLENPLYVALTVLLFYLLLRYVFGGLGHSKTSVLVAAVVVALALTRPEGVLYGLVFIVVLAIGLSPRGSGGIRRTVRLSTRYLISAAVLYGAFLLFRLAYFGYPFPNTYYAKGGPSWRILYPLLTLQGPYFAKAQELLSSCFGHPFWFVLPFVLLISIMALVFEKTDWRGHKILVIMTVTALLIYLLMPIDWMGEYRFATPFFVFYYSLVAVQVAFIVHRLFRSRRTRRFVGLALVLGFVGASVGVHQSRLQEFYENPVVPFASAAARFAFPFNTYAARLDVTDPSLLVPDIGGTLFYSNIRIVDLGGLCDETIAHTRGKDQQRFWDYIFDDVKPSFIHTHGYFTAVSRFDDDPRFARDYVPISEYVDKYVETRYKATRVSGTFVRKEIALGREAILDSIRHGLIR